MTKWVWSVDGESYLSEFFGTMNDARECAFEEAEPGSTIYVGQAIHPRCGDYADGNAVLHMLHEGAQEDGIDPDWFGDWLSCLSQDVVLALKIKVASAINEWADKQGQHPTFFTVIGAESFDVPEEADDD